MCVNKVRFEKLVQKKGMTSTNVESEGIMPKYFIVSDKRLTNLLMGFTHHLDDGLIGKKLLKLH